MNLSGQPNQPTAYDFIGQMEVPVFGVQMIGRRM